MSSILLCNNCQHLFLPANPIQRFPQLPSPARLSEIMRSNTLPTHEEKEQTRSYIEAEEYEMERYDQEIIRLRKTIEQLETRRDLVSRRIQHYRSWLSPIRQLPIEVLEYIFAMICLPRFGGAYSLAVEYSIRSLFPNCVECAGEQFDPHNAPTATLSHVSHHWKSTVYASARLWSSLKVDVSWPGPCMLLGLYLSNSKECPLHLELQQQRHGYCFSMITALSPHFPRIASLVLAQDCVTIFDNVFDIRPLNPAPQLTNAKIECIPDIPDSFFPFEQLTTLEIGQVDECSAFLAVLRRCTNLRSLDLVHVMFEPPHNLAIDRDHLPTRLQSLRHLSASLYSVDSYIILFQSLILPSLASLKLCVTQMNIPPTPVDLVPVANLINRSGCQQHLTRFSLGTQAIQHTGVFKFLDQCSALSRLQFNVVARSESGNRESFGYRLVDALSSNSGTLVAPRLVELYVFENSCVNVGSANALLDMLEARVRLVKDSNRTRGDSALLLQSSKWDFSFGESDSGYPAEGVLIPLRDRLKKLAESGLRCCIDWM
ncbi:hypothetical protein VNI00_016786 [Paramarasmius palmivorus]|uniref:F-box domain-containing protein n=1 Tax=Paramarasmius palmivorus TaxID=297713 RepID=A0AAW0BD02_9AGAR